MTETLVESYVITGADPVFADLLAERLGWEDARVTVQLGQIIIDETAVEHLLKLDIQTTDGAVAPTPTGYTMWIAGEPHALRKAGKNMPDFFQQSWTDEDGDEYDPSEPDPVPLTIDQRLQDLAAKARDAQDLAGWAEYETTQGRADLAHAVVELGRVVNELIGYVRGLAHITDAQAHE